jgi:hypothetical protein
MTPVGIQYVPDEQGNTTSVIVPIDLWHKIVFEDETASYWLNVSQPSLDEIWNNEEDNIYCELKAVK